MLETDTLSASKTLLDVRDLRMHFPLSEGIIFQRTANYVRAVDGVSFTIERGQTLGLVGESGSGKTTLGRTVVRLYRPTTGQMLFDTLDLATLQGEQLRKMRQRVQMVDTTNPITGLKGSGEWVQVGRNALPLFDAGRLRTPLAATFPLEDAEAAYDRFAAGAKLGKIVLTAG